MQHLLSWQDWTQTQWHKLLERACELSFKGHHWQQRAIDKSLGLVFFNPSLRTRSSMELAAAQLGAHVSLIEPGSGVWDMEWRDDVIMDGTAAEHIEEAFGVLSQYFDALGVRLFADFHHYSQNRDETIFKKILKASKVPVINLESAFYHPCQSLADAVSLRQYPPQGKKFVLSWCYHPKALPMAVANSTLLMAAREGYEVTVLRPDEFALDPEVMTSAQQLADDAGGSIHESSDRTQSLSQANVIYAKAWASKTAYSDSEKEQVIRANYQDWRITQNDMGNSDRAWFMHPLPVRRGVVVDTAVLKSDASLHLSQARNRLFAQKAILETVWGLGS